jgi:hypothetical protein
MALERLQQGIPTLLDFGFRLDPRRDTLLKRYSNYTLRWGKDKR